MGIYTEISSALGRATIGVTSGDVLELRGAGDDVLAERFELRNGDVTSSVTDDLAFWIFPGSFAPGSFVLYQYVGSPNLIKGR